MIEWDYRSLCIILIFDRHADTYILHMPSVYATEKCSEIKMDLCLSLRLLKHSFFLDTSYYFSIVLTRLFELCSVCGLVRGVCAVCSVFLYLLWSVLFKWLYIYQCNTLIFRHFAREIIQQLAIISEHSRVFVDTAMPSHRCLHFASDLFSVTYVLHHRLHQSRTC